LFYISEKMFRVNFFMIFDVILLELLTVRDGKLSNVLNVLIICI